MKKTVLLLIILSTLGLTSFAQPGNPNVFGTNEWIVYAYDGNNFNTYAGFYTEPNITFDTRDRWSTFNSPSNASGYQGNMIPTDQHSYSHKRTGFTCGTYQIDITNHDDNAELLINGLSIFTHNGWGDSHTSVYSGFLGPTSTVEFRIREGVGNSHSGLSITQINNNPSFTISSAYNCNTGENNLITNGASGVTWSPATGLNTTSGSSVIATPTTTITYTATGISDCNGFTSSETITVTPSHLSFNPNTDFGNGEWNIFCYDGYNFSTYNGYYKEPNLSFDTRNRWGANNSPSDASDYLGCIIPNNQHSYSHKRTNFACGDYIIDITNHDDDVELLIDGNSIFVHAGCCDAHTSVYTGFLGPNSTVELRVQEGGGGSHSGLSINQQNTNSGFSVTSSYDCNTGSSTLIAIGASGETWSPATGLNTTSGSSVIATPTTTTTYTVTGILDCDGLSTSETVTVSPSHLALDPLTYFGDGEWTVFCYDGNNFNTYNGYYIEGSLDFDSRNRWGSNNTPSDASGYTGCAIPINQHSFSYKRTNFACGNYSIDIAGHDDYATLLIDGIQVWNHNGCCDVHNGVWSGSLNASSTVEFRTREFNGGSYAALNLNTSITSSTWLGNNTNWNDNSNWSNGSPSNFISAIITTSSNNPTISNTANCNDIIINNGTTLTISGSNSLNINGTWTNNGTFIANASSIVISDACNSTNTITNTNATTFNNLTLNTTGNIVLSGAEVSIQESLTLTNGAFNTNNTLTLLSNATGTGNIAAISGGTISGNITMQRYINEGETNWRFFTSPILNSTLEDWDDNFETSGFTGTDAPNWPSAANPWPSMYFYNESIAGDINNGYEPATNTNNLIGLGKGVSVWCGDTLSGTQPFTIDVIGEPNTGNTNTPLSFSNGTNTGDGWNLVGNPYPSSIDWDSPNINKIAMNNAIYVWDPDAQQYSAYVNGIGINGGSSIIPSSQAFFVEANSSSGEIQYTENCKTNNDGTFFKTSSNSISIIINVENQSGKDQSIINFNNSSTNLFDYNYDAHKVYSSNTNYPSLSSISNDIEYSINQIPSTTIDIPIKLISGLSGLHLIDFTLSYDMLNRSCVTLTDLFTNNIHDLLTNPSLTVSISDTTNIHRFILHLGPEIIVNKTNPTCFNNNDGSLSFSQSNNAAFSINWLNNNRDTILSENTVTNSQVNNLHGGVYYLYASDISCLNKIDTLLINTPDSININGNIDHDLGSINLQVNGGTPPFIFNWSNGSTNQHQTNLSPGNYTATITDAKNCLKTETYNINLSNDIKKYGLKNIKIYPNPANGIVSIELEKVGYRIELYNSLGQNVFTDAINSKFYSINSKDFANGIYTLKISNHENTAAFKLIFD